MIDGLYYLHVNGDLIYKRDLDGQAADIRESDLARGLWFIDAENRETAWAIVVEAWAAGANKERVTELAGKWGLSDEDAAIYAERVGAQLYKDGSAWCATRKDFKNLQESPAGFDEVAWKALGNLCKELGYKPSKMWGMSFAGLLK